MSRKKESPAQMEFGFDAAPKLLPPRIFLEPESCRPQAKARYELQRVSKRIQSLILDFCRCHPEFIMSDLQDYVRTQVPDVAPDSTSRVLRDLRSRGLVDYEVLSRTSSLYRVNGVIDASYRV